MKKLWLAVLTLALIFLLTLINAAVIQRRTDILLEGLRRAETAALSGDWEAAQDFTRKAQAQWQKDSGYFYLVLRHSDTDAVQTGFQEALALLGQKETVEYAAANARLTAPLLLLADMEAPTLKNIL